MTPQRVPDLVDRDRVTPIWMSSQAFWYFRSDAGEGSYRLIDSTNGAVKMEIGADLIVSGLTRSGVSISDATGMRVSGVQEVSSGYAFSVATGNDDQLSTWLCTGSSAFECRPDVGASSIAQVLSPDRKWLAFVREHDLWLKNTSKGEEIRLTTDGSENHGYGEMPDGAGSVVSNRLAGKLQQPRVLWAPDSQHFVTYRVDQRDVKSVPLVDYLPKGTGPSPRPMVHDVKVHFPGDENVATAQLIVFAVDDHKRIDIEGDPIVVAYEPLSVPDNGNSFRYNTGLVRWSSDGQHLLVLREERGFGKYRVERADVATGTLTTLVEESKGAARYAMPALRRYPPIMYEIPGSNDLLIFSQRTGWGHLYRYRADGSERFVNAVTSGDWNVEEVLGTDPSSRWLFFTGVGRESGSDPYATCLYRVDLTSMAIELLTPERANHSVKLAPDRNEFIDTYSSVDQAPVTVLRRCDGSFIATLEVADVSRLLATGWRWPERFSVKARDGKTDIYGVLYRPRDFDPRKKYAVIDSVYSSQPFLKVEPTFAYKLEEFALADLGAIVVAIDGLSTPLRSLAFRDAEDYRGASGLADHPSAIRQLASRYPFVDADRVGIYGCSGGGYGAARGMLMYPDVYKVGVAYAGNHDSLLYNLQVGEKYLGMPADVPDVYADQATKNFAKNLRGRLLLIQGLLDDTVNPVNTMQLAQALIDADKRFDLMLFPKLAHCKHSDYTYNLIFTYFQEHLISVNSP